MRGGGPHEDERYGKMSAGSGATATGGRWSGGVRGQEGEKRRR